ncbi:MAG: hypothetical protein ACREUQ_14775 [Burkholderiales bacterium]
MNLRKVLRKASRVASIQNPLHALTFGALKKGGNVLKNAVGGAPRVMGENAAGAAAILAGMYGGKAIGAAGSKLFGGAAGAAGAGGMSGAGDFAGPQMPMGNGGAGPAAAKSMPLWRRAARGIFSGGKPLTLRNVGGGGGAGNILKYGAAAGLTAAGLKEALARRRLQNRMLEQTVGIGEELATRGRSLTAGADRLRLPAESQFAQLMAQGQRPAIDPSQFADMLNPYRRRFGGAPRVS